MLDAAVSELARNLFTHPSTRVIGVAVVGLQWKYTLDDWATFSTVEGRLSDDGEALEFLVPVQPGQVARVEGLLLDKAGAAVLKHSDANFQGYVFAAPDSVDLKLAIERAAQGYPGQI